MNVALRSHFDLLIIDRLSCLYYLIFVRGNILKHARRNINLFFIRRLNCTIAQTATSCLVVETQVETQLIRGGQSDTGASFSELFGFIPANYLSTIAP
jgi:hypothetical protein